MHRTQHRVLLTATAGAVALALGATPALAGSDGCSGRCDEENAPAPLLQVAPTPPAPQQLAETSPTPDTTETRRTPETTEARRTHRARAGRSHVRAVTVSQRTAPRGAVAAGAGGTAPHGPEGLLALLAGGALVLMATGGGLVATARRGS
jgi:hypothetical protein